MSKAFANFGGTTSFSRTLVDFVPFVTLPDGSYAYPLVRKPMKTMHQYSDQMVLRTSAGDFPLNEYCLNTRDREFRVLHVNTLLSLDEESSYLLNPEDRLPYGTTLWAAAIALAHELVDRDGFRGTAVLELGAGTGLPGIVASANGARVVQTDSNKVAMSLARRNALRNRVESVEQRIVEWSKWNDRDRYDWIVGSDILYSAEMHPHLTHIFESNLVPGGKVLISDPFRATSLRLLEALERSGWTITISKWSVGEEASPRALSECSN